MTTETTPIDKMLQDAGMEDILVKYVNQVKGNAWNSPQNCRVGKRYRLLISTLPIAEGLIGVESVGFVKTASVKKMIDAIDNHFGNPGDKFTAGGLVSNKECMGDCNVQNLHGSYSHCSTCNKVIQ